MTNIYEKIGGEAAVNAAVDIFYKKILADDVVNHFFEKIDMDRQIQKQKDFMKMVFGGPSEYTGDDMRTAHAHLALEEEHFTAVAGHLKATLEELNVPEDLQDEVMTLVGSTHDDILDL